MGGNFKFQVQDSFLEIYRFEKRIALSGKKTPLGPKTVSESKQSQGLLSPVAYLIYAKLSVIIVCRLIGK